MSKKLGQTYKAGVVLTSVDFSLKVLCKYFSCYLKNNKRPDVILFNCFIRKKKQVGGGGGARRLRKSKTKEHKFLNEKKPNYKTV